MSNDNIIRLPVKPRLQTIDVGEMSDEERREWAYERLTDAVRIYRTVCGSRMCLDALIGFGIEECEFLARQTRGDRND